MKTKGLLEQISAYNRAGVQDFVPAQPDCPPSPSRPSPHRPQIWAGEIFLKGDL